MEFRFQKRITLFKGVRLDLSNSGVSAAAGRPWASLNFGGKGTGGNIGWPGACAHGV